MNYFLLLRFSDFFASFFGFLSQFHSLGPKYHTRVLLHVSSLWNTQLWFTNYLFTWIDATETETARRRRESEWYLCRKHMILHFRSQVPDSSHLSLFNGILFTKNNFFLFFLAYYFLMWNNTRKCIQSCEVELMLCR